MKGVQCYELFGGIALKIHTFSFSFFFKADKERIDGIIRKAGGIIGEPQTTVDSVYDCLLQSKLDLVWKDPGHPLHCHLHNNIITRGSGRLRLPPLRTNRHRNSFIPRAIKLYNNNICR